MNTYEKWMDFSTRLITVLYTTDERKEKVHNEVTNFIRKFKDEEIHGWDTFVEYEFYGKHDIGGIAEDITYFGRYRLDSMHEPKWNSFYNQISVATRAGLDVATEEFSGGVIGLTIGDLQDMYEDDIPDWVKNSIGIIDENDSEEEIWL